MRRHAARSLGRMRVREAGAHAEACSLLLRDADAGVREAAMQACASPAEESVLTLAKLVQVFLVRGPASQGVHVYSMVLSSALA